MGRPASDKRERLIDAAVARFRLHGVAASSLADIARDADIAPGNVYYHFATKDALAAAVIDSWCARIDAYLAELETVGGAGERLRAFVERAEARRGSYTALGCPLAALSRDLFGGALAKDAARPLTMQQRWLAAQFEQLGVDRATADGHAQFLLASLQGSYILAQASADASIISATSRRLLAWLDAAQRVR